MPNKTRRRAGIAMEALARLKEYDALLTLHFENLAHAEHVADYFFHLPWPAWLKGTDGRVLATNPAYTERYGADEADMVGQSDGFWPPVTTRQFQANDSEVARTGKARTYVERIYNPKTGKHENITVVKFPVYSGMDLVGVGGFAIYLPT
jgi:PAS domain-containing protein